jgi:hypothetical protein
VADQVAQVEQEKMLWTEFLESCPPGKFVLVKDAFKRVQPDVSFFFRLSKSDIQLHCTSDVCGGLRFFAYASEEMVVQQNEASSTPKFLSYFCRNCNQTGKIFALLIQRHEGTSEESYVLKIGEWPSFGPPVPPRVISLIGPDRDIFLQGRRSENQGLGIGAFAYYRRVVENQKGRLIAEIAKVAKRLGASPEVLSLFERAASETQFSTAIDYVKDAIPQSLLIHSQNPLSLLHSALSQGLHAQSDEECLELAQFIRIVLTELADSISQALKDEAELKHAVSRLLQARSSSSSPSTKGII